MCIPADSLPSHANCPSLAHLPLCFAPANPIPSPYQKGEKMRGAATSHVPQVSAANLQSVRLIAVKAVSQLMSANSLPFLHCHYPFLLPTFAPRNPCLPEG